MISFFVEGTPAPGGSKNAFALKKGGVYTGRVAISDAGGQKNKDWRKVVATVGRMQYGGKPLLTSALRVSMLFVMKRPGTHFGSKGGHPYLREDAPVHHVQKPDATKLLRAAEDALTGVIWVDDATIVSVTSEKKWAKPGHKAGCLITITEL